MNDTPRLVALRKVSSVDFLEQVFACYRDGLVAAPVDDEATLADLPVGETRPVKAGGGWFAHAQAPIEDDRPAQLSFSSGTTGTPKAVLISHRALADVTRRLVEVMRLDGSIREYLGVPATYSFGLGRARAVSAVGGRLFVPEHGFDPVEFSRMLAADEINSLSAVPTLLRTLLRDPGLVGKGADKLRWLEIGSQAMTAEEKRALVRLFPNARIVQHYGLTEASRTTFLVLNEASDAALASVGRAIGDTQVRIDGEGRICIRGPHLALGLLTPSGVDPITDGEGWLVTRDAGHLADGLLHFDGRLDDLVNVGGIKVSADDLERALAARLPDSVEVAAGPAPDAQRGERVLVAWSGDARHAGEVATAVGEVAPGFGVPATAVTVFTLAVLPRTATGKLQRKRLAELQPAEAPTLPPTPPAPSGADDRLPRTDAERRIAALWEEALQVSPVYRDESFLSMGGDSLSAINAILTMEKAGIPGEVSRRIFEGHTIAQIAAELGDDRLPGPGTEQKIAAIWEEALQTSPVYRDESFLSMGGDSLSAINALLIMEKAGIDAEISRRIFEGRTIAEIALDIDSVAAASAPATVGETSAAPTPSPAPAPALGMTAEARVNEGLNIARGVLITIVIISHWGPFLLARMGELGSQIGYFVNPFFRMGTPGFAVVFGMGVGYLQYHGIKRNRETVLKRLRSGAWIMAAGIAMLAVVRYIDHLATGEPLGAQWPAALFYSVLVYYLLATLLIDPILRVIDSRPNIVLNAIIGALVLWAVYHVCAVTLDAYQTQGLAEFGRLMLATRYGLPAMLPPTLAGIAAGLWLRLNLDREDLTPLLAKAGFVIVGGGILVAIATGDFPAWFTRTTSGLPQVFTYVGLVVLIMALTLHSLARRSGSRAGEVVRRLISLTGILAFPAYVGHELVIPLKNVLATIMPEMPAMAIAVALFLVPFAYLVVRLNRIVNAGRWTTGTR